MENNHGITETPQPKDPAAVRGGPGQRLYQACLLYTSDAADEL